METCWYLKYLFVKHTSRLLMGTSDQVIETASIFCAGSNCINDNNEHRQLNA